jgi:GTP-binding protein
VSIYQNAQLLLSVAAPSQFPADQGAEVAIAGRSNAGKSSAINAITGRRALARTSKSPGRTRLLNFFELAPLARLIDLPGYGYAEGRREDRADWARLIDALAPRRSLKGLLLVVDSRRGVQDSDEQLLAWAQLHERPVHVLLSKVDQLRRSEGRQLLVSARAQLATRAAVQLFSARDGTGVDEARARLQSWLAEGRQGEVG